MSVNSDVESGHDSSQKQGERYASQTSLDDGTAVERRLAHGSLCSGYGPCRRSAAAEAPAAEAPARKALAHRPRKANGPGVDPGGQTVFWWHNTPVRDEQLTALLAQFDECGITVVSQSQGGYDEIRDKVNASIAAGEQPAALIAGYQNDQAFYQLNDALVDLNTLIDDPKWGLTPEDKADFYASFRPGRASCVRRPAPRPA